MSWADERGEDEGYEMIDDWLKQAGSMFQGVNGPGSVQLTMIDIHACNTGI